jgi:hypothetical protein
LQISIWSFYSPIYKNLLFSQSLISLTITYGDHTDLLICYFIFFYTILIIKIIFYVILIIKHSPPLIIRTVSSYSTPMFSRRQGETRQSTPFQLPRRIRHAARRHHTHMDGCKIQDNNIGKETKKEQLQENKAQLGHNHNEMNCHLVAQLASSP